MNNLGIIGTALRGKDTEFDTLCTKDTYLKMLSLARTKVKELNITTLVSGGAAFSDHIAVDLFYDYICKSVNKGELKLLIYYPTKLFDNTSKIGKSLIYYHKYFSNLVFGYEYESIKDIGYLVDNYPNQVKLEEEPISTNYEGFFNRNTKIANNSDYLLVFSYFDEKGNCLTNGTKDTITKFLRKNSEDKIIKVDLRNL